MIYSLLTVCLFMILTMLGLPASSIANPRRVYFPGVRPLSTNQGCRFFADYIICAAQFAVHSDLPAVKKVVPVSWMPGPPHEAICFSIT